MYHVYVRGQAYAAGGQHQQAVAEFQKILDHPGLMMGDPGGARARLEKARYADLDVPILAQAKADLPKLR